MPHPAARQGLANPHGDLRGQLFGQEEPGDVSSVTVDVDGEQVLVRLDPEKGPRWGVGGDDFVTLEELMPRTASRFPGRGRVRWDDLGVTEQEAALVIFARRLRALRSRPQAALSQAVALEDEVLEREDPAEAKERALIRCTSELARPPIPWQTISIDTVTNGHKTTARGMFYGLEFPWTESMLAQWGPEWLTKAFHAAGTLEKDNSVTKIIMERKIKVTTGNNGGKFLFEVEYAQPGPGLHRKLFAKVPFPLDGATRSDRLSSSVNKQPQEYYEFNSYRLLEGTMPVQIPKFYYGDISTESTNWILITERVAFADKAGTNFGKPKARRKPLAPYKIEGPYDKCLDHNLRGDPREYYLLLVRTGAQIAGLHKAGKLGSEEVLRENFQYMVGLPPEAFRIVPGAASGENPSTFSKKLDAAASFIGITGCELFPEYAVDGGKFMAKFTRTMMMINAYSGELTYWKHRDPDYVALTHQNMNVDNAYFWRSDQGELELGVFDWGGMGAMSIGHKLWWWVYCGDYEPLCANLDDYIAAFVEAYVESGGPQLDKDRLRSMVIITALEQMIGLIGAVPQILKMCPRKEWETIHNRYDPRIGENIDGKSTLRLYLHCMNSIVRIIEEMGGDRVLDEWVQSFWVDELKQQAKSKEAIGL